VSLSQTLIHEISDRLYEAERSCQPIDSLAKTYPSLTDEDSYGIQLVSASRVLRDGGRVVGYKIGLTSREAQRYFNVFKPDFGHLFDHMAVLEDEEIALSRLIQPKIEGEIAFVLGRDIKGPGVTIVDVLNAVDYALVSMEIIDSRIRDWKITATDTIADNGSSALFVLSAVKKKIEGNDLSTVGMALSRNGEIMQTGAGAAVMGNPLNAVVFLANELGKHDRALLAGEVILSGAMAGMLAVAPGDSYTCEMLGLGRVSVRFGQGEKR
jgi:2-keto-4-pentenoate hydratase